MDPPARPPAKKVGDEFAKTYYTVLQDYPQHLRKLYEDSSKIGRTGNNGMMCFYTLLDIDDENLNMLSYGGFDSAEVTSIISKDCQGGGGVLVVVCGYSTLKETTEMMNFIQVFLLAPQKEGYFVLIDMLHFDDQTIVSASNVIEEEVAETEVTRKEVAETEVTRKEVAEVAETEVTRKEVTETEVSRKEVAEVLETEVTRKEVGDGLLRVSEPSDGREDVSKISDASADVKVIQKGQGQHPSCDPNDDTGNGNNQESQVFTQGSTVHVRNLPPNDTTAKVEDKFKTFGPIREIRVQNPGLDHYYAFVEFKEADAAKRAIKASPVKIDGRQVHVEKTRAVTEGAGICVKNLPPDATIALVRNAFEQFGAIRRDGVHVTNKGGYSYGFIDFEEENAAWMAIEASPLIVLGQRAYVEKKLPAYRSDWKSPSSGQGKIDRGKEVRGTRAYDFWDWQKSKEEQSKRQEEEGGTGIDHSWDSEQVMEEQRKLEEEQRKLEEEQSKHQEEQGGTRVEHSWNYEQVMEEQRKLQEEKMKFQKEKMKFQEETMKLQEETMKLQEEKTKFQEEKMKFQEEKMKFQEEKMKFQEERMKLQEEKTKFQEEKMKFQEEKMKLQEERRSFRRKG